MDTASHTVSIGRGGVFVMNTIVVLPAALAALLAVGVTPVCAAPIPPGPVKVVLPMAEDSSEGSRLGDVSQIIVPPTFHIDLPATGAVVWKGRLTRSGELIFPADQQTWPAQYMVAGIKIKGLHGTLSTKGRVALRGKIRATVGGCRVSGPVSLSSAYEGAPLLPSGTRYNRGNHSFAVTGRPFALTRTGQDCALVPSSIVLFIKGTLTPRR